MSFSLAQRKELKETFSCSFLLTAEEKEPKKTATPKPLHRGFNLKSQKPSISKVLVRLTEPVPLRGES